MTTTQPEESLKILLRTLKLPSFVCHADEVAETA